MDVNVIEGFQYLFMDGTTYKDHEQEGEPNIIKYGKSGIKEGDIIFFCYSPDTAKKKCKRWHHVGAIYEDSGPDGKPDKILGGDDIILHAGPREPHLSKLASAAFVDEDPTAIIIGRWKIAGKV